LLGVVLAELGPLSGMVLGEVCRRRDGAPNELLGL
jgi:hypothetical protein